MSIALLDELMARFQRAPVEDELPTPAKPAKAANVEHSGGPGHASASCERLRIDANEEPDSRTFAGIRNLEDGPQGKQRHGSSQISQHSHGSPETGDNDVGLLSRIELLHRERLVLLMRWGWRKNDAEAQADRLKRRDAETDERVSCTDCQHYRPNRCGNHRAAELGSGDLSLTLASLLQRCPGFRPFTPMIKPDHGNQ